MGSQGKFEIPNIEVHEHWCCTVTALQRNSLLLSRLFWWKSRVPLKHQHMYARLPSRGLEFCHEISWLSNFRLVRTAVWSLCEMWLSFVDEHPLWLIWLSDAGTLLHCRKARLVVGIDQVDAVPRLTPNKRQLMHITCHGKTVEPSNEVLMFHAFFKTSNWHIQTSVCCLLSMRKVKWWLVCYWQNKLVNQTVKLKSLMFNIQKLNKKKLSKSNELVWPLMIGIAICVMWNY